MSYDTLYLELNKDDASIIMEARSLYVSAIKKKYLHLRAKNKYFAINDSHLDEISEAFSKWDTLPEEIKTLFINRIKNDILEAKIERLRKEYSNPVAEVCNHDFIYSAINKGNSGYDYENYWTEIKCHACEYSGVTITGGY